MSSSVNSFTKSGFQRVFNYTMYEGLKSTNDSINTPKRIWVGSLRTQNVVVFFIYCKPLKRQILLNSEKV